MSNVSQTVVSLDTDSRVYAALIDSLEELNFLLARESCYSLYKAIREVAPNRGRSGGKTIGVHLYFQEKSGRDLSIGSRENGAKCGEASYTAAAGSSPAMKDTNSSVAINGTVGKQDGGADEVNGKYTCIYHVVHVLAYCHA